MQGRGLPLRHTPLARSCNHVPYPVSLSLHLSQRSTTAILSRLASAEAATPVSVTEDLHSSHCITGIWLFGLAEYRRLVILPTES
jgi:hypothetical protein